MSTENRTRTIQLVLFILTLITTTLSGAEWITGKSVLSEEHRLLWGDFIDGLQFSIPFLLILTVHEFGHYFAAKAHHVKVTLPYYIPFWIGISQSIGTLGAFIKITSQVKSRTKFFDIGVAGPLAGFVAALIVLWYGFTHLPPAEFIFQIHPEYEKYGSAYPLFVYENNAGSLVLGDNILFRLFKTYVANPALLPHEYEIIHYPYLFAGYLALFFTSLNLIPIGQLDGGHVLSGLIGPKNFNKVSPVIFFLFILYSGTGLFKVQDFAVASNSFFYPLILQLSFYIFFLYICFKTLSKDTALPFIASLFTVLLQLIISWIMPLWEGYPGFLVFGFVLGRFLGIHHPETQENQPLTKSRIVIGILALVIFILCFSPKPFIVL